MSLDELLLRPLGVADAADQQLDVRRALQLVPQDGDGVGLVALHRQHRLGELQQLQHIADARQHLLRVLQQGPVVGGDVGLALGGVDDEGVHLAQGAGDLHMGGEGGASHAHDAILLDKLQQAGRVLFHLFRVGMDALVHPVQMVVFDHHGHDRLPVGVEPGLHGRHRAGHAGVDDGGDRRLAAPDDLPQLDVVPFFHRGRAGRADVHGHGDDHLVRRGQWGDGGGGGQPFPVVRVDAAEKGMAHGYTSLSCSLKLNDNTCIYTLISYSLLMIYHIISARLLSTKLGK